MKKATLAATLVCIIWLATSLWQWLRQPNNFLYTIETNGRWSMEEIRNYKARGYHLKIDSACAAPVYQEISTPKTGTHDFARFTANRTIDIEFFPEEISSPSRFKWHSESYITYDDPGLSGGIRYSFRNKCLYDRECSLRDSADYLFVKIGLRYFINPEQFARLEKCVAHKEMFYEIKNTYNFGRSDRHHRNGILLWLGDRLTAL